MLFDLRSPHPPHISILHHNRNAVCHFGRRRLLLFFPLEVLVSDLDSADTVSNVKELRTVFCGGSPSQFVSVSGGCCSCFVLALLPANSDRISKADWTAFVAHLSSWCAPTVFCGHLTRHGELKKRWRGNMSHTLCLCLLRCLLIDICIGVTEFPLG